MEFSRPASSGPQSSGFYLPWDFPQGAVLSGLCLGRETVWVEMLLLEVLVKALSALISQYYSTLISGTVFGFYYFYIDLGLVW